MNRLTDIHLGNTHSQIVYDPLGRMTDKEADGQTVFANAGFTAPPGQPTRPHAMTSAETTEDAFPAATQSIVYTSFDKVKGIVEDDNYIIYTYGYDQQRIHLTESVDGVMRLKEYVVVCEFITDDYANSPTLRSLTYLVGPYGVFAAVEKRGSAETVHYILKDHLGSWTTITDAEGVVEQELSFDAWGGLRNPDTWSGGFSGTPMFDRGFTGHEHISAFGLVNMNGRCYDPVTSHFLSVDAYVQDPTSAQAFNRYAYCAHNPLRYTDPTGWLCGNPNPIRQSNGANYNTETTWQSDDINDVLWGRSVHPCETGNPYWTNSSTTTYTQGNKGIFGCNFTVDKRGYITNVGGNEKPCDVLYTLECWDNGRMNIFVELPIGILTGRKTISGEGTNGITYTFDMYTLLDDGVHHLPAQLIMEPVSGLGIIEILVVPIRTALIRLVTGEIHPIASFGQLQDVEIIDKVHSDSLVVEDLHWSLRKTDTDNLRPRQGEALERITYQLNT